MTSSFDICKLCGQYKPNSPKASITLPLATVEAVREALKRRLEAVENRMMEDGAPEPDMKAETFEDRAALALIDGVKTP